MSTFAAQMERIRQNARSHERAQLDATRAALETWAASAQVFMRDYAPWNNRTGQARWGATAENPIATAEQITGDGLHWKAIHPDAIDGTIALITDAPYGIYLETARGAAYAIIMPTVAIHGPALLKALREIWHP